MSNEPICKKSKTIGIIGLGDMGFLYARRFSQAGWKVIGCDREDRYEETKAKYKDYEFEVLQSTVLLLEVKHRARRLKSRHSRSIFPKISISYLCTHFMDPK